MNYRLLIRLEHSLDLLELILAERFRTVESNRRDLKKEKRVLFQNIMFNSFFFNCV